MSASRLVMARTWGLPFTLLKSTTGPPSRCFCTPVISKSGSTSTSVLKTSPCVSSHSSAERREVISFTTSFLVTSANTVAMISLLLFYVEQTVSLFLLLNRELESLRHKLPQTHENAPCSDNSSYSRFDNPNQSRNTSSLSAPRHGAALRTLPGVSLNS